MRPWEGGRKKGERERATHRGEERGERERQSQRERGKERERGREREEVALGRSAFFRV